MADLIIKNLSIFYGNRDILHDVSISFNGGLNYLIGLNGSGKTSLLHAIIGLVSYTGEIKWNSQELSTLPSRERAQNIALLSQRLQLPFRTQVFDFVLMGRFPYLNWLGNYSQNDYEIVDQALERMHLQDFRHRSMSELSGGEFQRANLARALCQDSPILLLDEPAQSLDPKNKVYLYNLLAQLAEEHVVICATHDLDHIQDTARVIGLKNGHITWDRRGAGDTESLMLEVYGDDKLDFK